MKKSKLHFALSITFLSMFMAGCSSHSNTGTDDKDTEKLITDNIEKSIEGLERVQAELYQSAAINNHREGISGGIYSDGQKIDMQWDGDAKGLVQKLANQRSYRFSTSGVRLPLPVNVHMAGVAYGEVLERVQTQIGYRATLVVDNRYRTILLRYNSPVSPQGENDARVVKKGGYTAPVSSPGRISHSANPIKPVRTYPVKTAVSYHSTTSIPIGSPGTLKSCRTVCSVESSGFFTPVPADKIQTDVLGQRCSVQAQLSRDSRGKPLSCREGKWRKL